VFFVSPLTRASVEEGGGAVDGVREVVNCG
jgi:hypothetical protein